jgi:hypothetical protein
MAHLTVRKAAKVIAPMATKPKSPKIKSLRPQRPGFFGFFFVVSTGKASVPFTKNRVWLL